MENQFLDFTNCPVDLEFDILSPIEFYKKCLYLRKIEGEYICYFKNIKVILTRVLFETLFNMAEEPLKFHSVVVETNDRGSAPETARKRIERIRKAFIKAGIRESIIIQRNGKYKINLEVIPEKYIITSAK